LQLFSKKSIKQQKQKRNRVTTFVLRKKEGFLTSALPACIVFWPAQQPVINLEFLFPGTYPDEAETGVRE